MRTLLTVGVLGLLLAVSADCYAQGGMPDRKAIEERIRAAFPQIVEQSPEETIEIAGVCKITYKKIPTDPAAIAKLLGQQMGGGGLPAGADIDQYVGMFQPQITALLNENLGDIGKFEALKELKVKSKRIPIGEHRIGILFDGERPVALSVFNKDKEKMKKPVPLRLKTKSVKEPLKELKLEVKEDEKKKKKGKEAFEVRVAFLRFKAKTKAKPEAVPES